MEVVLPTLTIAGFVTDENVIMSRLYEYFLTTQNSQSVLYSYYINSYYSAIKDNSVDESIVKENIGSSLSTLYSNYFTNVEVDISLTSRDDSGGSVFSLGIRLTCDSIKDGTKYYLNKSMTIDSGKVKDLETILDYFNS